MVQRLRANGVQVVGGSNPPCPTKIAPNRDQRVRCLILFCAASVTSVHNGSALDSSTTSLPITPNSESEVQ
jgi:hypothetical protein